MQSTAQPAPKAPGKGINPPHALQKKAGENRRKRRKKSAAWKGRKKTSPPTRHPIFKPPVLSGFHFAARRGNILRTPLRPRKCGIGRGEEVPVWLRPQGSRGRAVSFPTRFARSSGGGQVSAAGRWDGAHRGVRDFAQYFRSARCGVWRGSGRRWLARDRFQRRAERLDFVAGGGQQSSTVSRGTRLTGGVCCGAMRDDVPKNLTPSQASRFLRSSVVIPLPRRESLGGHAPRATRGSHLCWSPDQDRISGGF